MSKRCVERSRHVTGSGAVSWRCARVVVCGCWNHGLVPRGGQPVRGNRGLFPRGFHQNTSMLAFEQGHGALPDFLPSISPYWDRRAICVQFGYSPARFFPHASCRPRRPARIRSTIETPRPARRVIQVRSPGSPALSIGGTAWCHMREPGAFPFPVLERLHFEPKRYLFEKSCREVADSAPSLNCEGTAYVEDRA